MLRELTIAASFEPTNGYGFFTVKIIEHLVQCGVRVKLTPIHGHPPVGSLRPYLNPAPPKVHDIMFTSISNNPTDVSATVLVTMSETMAVPWEYGHSLGRHKHVIVPSKYSADAIAPWARKTRTKVHISPLGVTMPWSPTPFEPFTFTAIATDHACPERKRIQELTDTFSRTFPVEADVRLQLKRAPECRKIITFDSRVHIVAARLNDAAFCDLVHKTTVGVQPSLMEGWSLPTNQFIAVGRPVITGLAGAIGDWLTPEACFQVNHSIRRAPQAVYLGKGNIPYADMANIGRQMRFAYENRFEVARRGIAAYELSQKYTAHTMGQHFLDLCHTLF